MTTTDATELDLSTPISVVIGGSRGLGFLMAAELLSCGHLVVICARNPDELADAQRKLTTEGARVVTKVCDVTKPDEVTRVIDEVEAEVGPIEAAFHVAGIIEVGPWQASRREHFERCIDVMLYGPLNLALAVLPRMTGRGYGRFGVVTSIGGRVSVPRLLPYSVAKFGAIGLVEGLAAELAGTGVTATAAVPGLMRIGSQDGAKFYGDPTRQYEWFAPSASAPVVTVSGEHAARTIVAGTLAGRPVVNVGWTTRIAALAHGVAPGWTTRAMGLVSRVLPTGDDPTPVPGREARKGSQSTLVEWFTRRGDHDAATTNQPD